MFKNRPLSAAIGMALAMERRANAVAEAVMGGDLELYHNGELVEITPNIIPAEWRSQILRQSYAGGAQISQFYIAPFVNEVDVEQIDTLTAANWGTQLSEFIAYDETARPQWQRDAEANQQIANATTLAKITVNAAGTIWGIVMVTNSAKGSTTGYIAAATKFGSGRGVQAGDTLEFKYTMRANLPA